jgi:hypothetical protein
LEERRRSADTLVDLAGRYMAILLLALFPIVFVFDTRLGAIMLVAAIVLQYRKSTARSVSRVRSAASERQKSWQDPWGTGAA